MKYFCYKQHSSVYLVTIIYYICNIPSFYIFYASSVALNIEETIKLKQNMHQNILNDTFKRLQVLFFVFKQFLIGLKQNLREEDNLSTRDKWPIPKVSSVRRFYCIALS